MVAILVKAFQEMLPHAAPGEAVYAFELLIGTAHGILAFLEFTLAMMSNLMLNVISFNIPPQLAACNSGAHEAGEQLRRENS
eukprot:1758670-Karenia_brevis.AAC.1